jgi:hypothetical protein
MSRDDEQVWAELVESFHASPDDESRRWPAAEDVEAEPVKDEAEAEDGTGETDQPAGDHPGVARRAEHPAHTTEQRAADPDEHFVPPPPPPLPSTDLITRLAWVGVLGTPLVFLVIVLLGQSVPGVVGAIGAGAFIGGFVILVARLRGHDPHDPDDGAVV